MSLVMILRSFFSGYALIFLNTNLYKEQGAVPTVVSALFSPWIQAVCAEVSFHLLSPLSTSASPPRIQSRRSKPPTSFPLLQSAFPEPAHLRGAEPISQHLYMRVQILETRREVSKGGLQHVRMARSTLLSQRFAFKRTRVWAVMLT